MTNYRLLTGIGAIAYVALGISAPLVSLYLEHLGADYMQISAILATYFGTVLISSYVWGKLSDRLVRRKPILVIGLFGGGVAFALMAQVPTPFAAWGTRVIEGTFLAAYTTLSLAMMGDALEQASPERRMQKGKWMGIYRGIGSLAFALGATAGGRVADYFSLNMAFWCCAVLYWAAGALACTLREAAVPQSPALVSTSQPLPNQVQAARQLPLPFLFGVLFISAAHSAAASMWPNYMASIGYTKSAIGALWGFAAAVEMPAMYFAGILSDITGRAVMLASGALGLGFVYAGYALWATIFPVLLLTQFIRGFGYGSYTTSSMTFAAEFGIQRQRGSHSGLFNTSASAGQLLGMALGGTLVQLAGFQIMFSVCVLFALLSTLCFWLLKLQSPHPADAYRSV
jgi:MFS transporter, PPP family, 3-phenylpropionic acid transporter